MLGGLAKAFAQMPDPPIRRVIVKTFLWSLALSIALFLAAVWGVGQMQATGMGWLDGTIEVLGGFAAFIIAILLFPGLASIVVGIFLEDVARAVEARHYPDLPEPRRQPLHETVWAAVKLAALAIVLNLLVLPVYLVPVINVFVFYALNGYLLGREYFELAALRRMSDPDARQMRRSFGARVFVAGIVITFLLSIPFVNWFMPVAAAAFIVHAFEGMRTRAESS